MKMHHNRAAKVGGRYAGYANGGTVGKRKSENPAPTMNGELQGVLRSNRNPLPRNR